VRGDSDDVPPISVITVVRDDRSRFSATAEQVLGQRGADFEWIVVDGGSRDGTLEVIRRYDRWIAAWRSGPDRGIYDAMNRGLALARGDYVVFMNAGDGFGGPGTLATAAAALRGAGGAVDLLFGGTIVLLPGGARIYRPPRSGAAWLRYGLPASHQATYIRRTLHLGVPHDLAYPVSSDYYTIARMCRAGARTLSLDLPLAQLDFGPENLSRRATVQRFRDFVAVQRRVLAQGWPALVVNTARLLCIHWAYRLVSSAWVGGLGAVLLRPWRPQAGLNP
jgi:putative colanic acid biosynthesis glycosyltransferase WcaE